MIPVSNPDGPKPVVRRARTKSKRNARLGVHNWVVSFGTLRLTYSSHAAALATAAALRLFGLISPVGLVGMHRELESDE